MKKLALLTLVLLAAVELQAGENTGKKYTTQEDSLLDRKFYKEVTFDQTMDEIELQVERIALHMDQTDSLINAKDLTDDQIKQGTILFKDIKKLTDRLKPLFDAAIGDDAQLFIELARKMKAELWVMESRLLKYKKAL